MHLLYPDPHPVPDDIPETLQILSTVDALGQLGVNVTLVTPEPDKPISPQDVLGHALSENVELMHLPRPKGRSNKPFYRALVAQRLEMGADAVLVRNLKMAEALLKAGETQLFFETHEHFTQVYREEHPNPGLKQRWKLRQLAKREEGIYRGAKGIITLTQLLAEDLNAAYGQLPPIAVAPDGVDLERAKESASGTLEAESQLLYLGSLHPWKGVEVLIEAMQWVDKARLRIVGGHPKRIEELQQKTRELGVADQVLFSGHVPPEQRFKVIAEADVCVLPLIDTSIGSRYTSPLKLFEYMAVGRAVVASDLPSLREILQDGQNALLTPAGDSKALAQALNRLMADTDLRNALAATARKDATHYSWVARARSILNLITSQ